MRKPHYMKLAVFFVIIGSILRILLWWSNPPTNTFDDHFRPIFMIMDSGTIPAKDACWQCYHPPVFYWISAMAGNIALNMGVNSAHILKFLQFIPCFYGILTLGVIYLILGKLPLSNFSSLIAFGTVCFLPRHIYMSAMNSNDTISYLFVALSIYLLVIAIERKLSPLILLTASVVISVTLFTKYTSYVLLPIGLIVFASLLWNRLNASRKQLTNFFVLVLLIPGAILSAYLISNVRNYGSPLPWNVPKLDFRIFQPRDKPSVDFFSFKPWESVNSPIIVPGKLHSFWTLVYDGMWFDNEPKFLYFMDSNENWWGHYYAWIRGEQNFPGDNPSMSHLTKLVGSCLIVLGLLPLLFVIIGIYSYFTGYWKIWTKANGADRVNMSIFPTLIFCNAAGMIALAVKCPVFSAMKSSYFLNSLPAFSVFLSLGLMPFEKNKYLRWPIVIAFGVLFALVGLHIMHICQTSRTNAIAIHLGRKIPELLSALKAGKGSP